MHTLSLNVEIRWDKTDATGAAKAGEAAAKVLKLLLPREELLVALAQVSEALDEMQAQV